MDRLNPGDYAFLMLTSKLGCPDRKPLTVAQLRDLFLRSDEMKRRDFSRDVDVYDFVSIGYGPKVAAHIVDLLHDELLLGAYMRRARKAKCVPITRATENYPGILRKRLALDSPGVLWAKGELSLLNTKAVALVGSRELQASNRVFAETAGKEVARQGYTLVSGNARGADKIAQNACLEAGGKVISVVADSLESHKTQENVLYLSEDVFDGEFSAQRALSRNRVIHALGYVTLVAQCNLHTGGTWDGTVKNLQRLWSPVFCYDDGSDACAQLQQRGATFIKTEQLSDIAALQQDIQKLI